MRIKKKGKLATSGQLGHQLIGDKVVMKPYVVNKIDKPNLQ